MCARIFWSAALTARLVIALAVTLGIGGPAHAVTFDWVTVDDPGNPADTRLMSDGTTGYGSVASVYRISKFEVTVAQYTEFLNAAAASDPNGVYKTLMGSGFFGNITRSGSDGSFSYAAFPGLGNRPMSRVAFYDMIRFVNWLDNGQPTGAQDSTTTEDGAYTITAQGILDNSIMRNPGATIFLPSENEWYKAAYYDAFSASYFLYPTGTDAQTTCAAPGPTANTANCGSVVFDWTDVGSYISSASPSGTFDQGGNVAELNETIIIGDSFGTPFSGRGGRGGGFLSSSTLHAASVREAFFATEDGGDVEFGSRVASLVPEPGADLLRLAALLVVGACASTKRRLRREGGGKV